MSHTLTSPLSSIASSIVQIATTSAGHLTAGHTDELRCFQGQVERATSPTTKAEKAERSGRTLAYAKSLPFPSSYGFALLNTTRQHCAVTNCLRDVLSSFNVQLAHPVSATCKSISICKNTMLMHHFWSIRA